ncbi:bifunctional demethylmenaquinone methyltransferase/2-methoxy-6-polyprenyl-1,4-benzoquinol methylase UbiE [Sulfurospirillum barnesii]|uniref:bifunctional demethylmenaquinone methyltransferase/2-methoxy-6-polyprenyl-1,4-benzoquinol methylase UbiE n=1 Tax=Sulfurospirillum barnesii TaxID=44674 RepID=UPI0002F912E6|nr:bifunctional demethylmenaquinone methyltransferase/2-methoxy-6-polyprenyl-1,4-benzoquinol methylase UbiE [Sulfurospirillum barnesii]
MVETNENKQQKIVQMFDDIAGTYDTANRVLSMGIDIQWRKRACDETFKRYEKPIELIVDVACGTGDMMGYWAKQAKKAGRKIGKILGVDPSVGMTDVGKQKFPEFEFVISEATALPLDNASADVVSISYGIRNVVKRQDAFREFARVLKSGGYVVILEFTKDDKKGFFFALKDMYLNKILPILGGFISKNKEAYEYLPNSIEGFLTAPMLQKELDEAGFEIEFSKSFSMDISTLVIAKKR